MIPIVCSSRSIFFFIKKTFCKNSKSDKNAHFFYCVLFLFFICLTCWLWWTNLCATKFSKVVVLWMANSNNFTSISWALADMILDKSFLWNNNKKKKPEILVPFYYWYQCTIYRIVFAPSQKPYRINNWTGFLFKHEKLPLTRFLCQGTASTERSLSLESGTLSPIRLQERCYVSRQSDCSEIENPDIRALRHVSSEKHQ